MRGISFCGKGSGVLYQVVRENGYWPYMKIDVIVVWKKVTEIRIPCISSWGFLKIGFPQKAIVKLVWIDENLKYWMQNLA